MSVMLLSGTPCPNGVIDAWVPGRIASADGQFWKPNFSGWRARHFSPVGDFNFRPKSDAVESRIREELARHSIAIDLGGSGAGVPEPFYAEAPFQWDAGHRARIQKFVATNEVDLPGGGKRVADSEGARLSVMRQLTSGLIHPSEGAPGVMLSDARLDALEGVIDSVEGPVLVAIFFKTEVAAILRRFGRHARAFTGSTSPAERTRLIDDWNAGRVRIMAAAPGAMGHGVNLQKGPSKTIAWHTHSFDWAQKAQLDARLVRSGQKHHVSIVSLIADLGIDRAVINALKRKSFSEAEILAEMSITPNTATKGRRA